MFIIEKGKEEREEVKRERERERERERDWFGWLYFLKAYQLNMSYLMPKSDSLVNVWSS